jgi:polysaccharide export outer membrane protein
MPRARLACLCLATALSGCASFLSQSGPSRSAVFDQAGSKAAAPGAQKLAYALVPLNAGVVAQMRTDDPIPRFSDLLTEGRVASGSLGVGDTLAITVFEAGAGGLFIPSDAGTRNGNSVQLPAQQIDTSGDISVPFAGSIRAAGLTTKAVEQEIDSRLAGRALDPQAIVTVTDRRAGAISITGEVGNAARFSLEPGGETVLGAIARAGGPRFPAYETTVTVQRGHRTERALLSVIMANPQQNIALQPGDGLYLAHTPRYFMAFGATGPAQSIGLVNRRFTFDGVHVSLADALAEAGGLEDDRANAQAIFVYRFERPNQDPDAPAAAPDTDRGVTAPTIYVLDLTNPAGYFYANQFRMHNEDTLFVSNSPSTDLGKFLALVLPAAYSAQGFNAGVN